MVGMKIPSEWLFFNHEAEFLLIFRIHDNTSSQIEIGLEACRRLCHRFCENSAKRVYYPRGGNKSIDHMEKNEARVVIVAPTFESAFVSTLSEELSRLFKRDEIAMRSATDEEDAQKECLKRALVQMNPTALISIDVRPDPETIAAYAAIGAPIILIDESANGVSTISTDNVLGGRLAGEHLIKKGRNLRSFTAEHR